MCLSWRSDVWLRRYCLFSRRPSPKLVCTNSLGIKGLKLRGRIPSVVNSSRLPITWWQWNPVQLGWPPRMMPFWYPGISEQLYVLIHKALTCFLHLIQRYQNLINRGGHPIPRAQVSMVTVLWDTCLILSYHCREPTSAWCKPCRSPPVCGQERHRSVEWLCQFQGKMHWIKNR